MVAVDLAGRLSGVRRNGDGFLAFCPKHEADGAGHSPSLSLKQDGDRVLLHCFGGCAPDAVLGALGLHARDLFSDEPKAPTTGAKRAHDTELGPIVAVYDYTDEAGALLYQSCRYAEPEKTFRQRRPDGSGGWIWKLNDVRRVLYRLPELHQQSVAYIVEGEKDVAALAAIGLTATTNAGGANTWRDEYSQQLKQSGVKYVVVLPDHDGPGEKHGEAVAASCAAAGLVVKAIHLPGLPAKGDVSDWLAAGHTQADLAALVSAAPAWTAAEPAKSEPSKAESVPFVLTAIGDLLAEPEETVDWLVDGLLTAGGVALMAAKPKVGKSTAARGLALAVARGDAWLGHPCAAGMVWYLAFEGRRRDVRGHFRQMGARSDDALRVFVGQAPRDVVAMVRRLAEQERPVLIIVDTMQRFLRAQSTDDYAEMTSLLDFVIGIAQHSGATILLLHHSGKADRASLDAVLGSTAITGSADTIILLARTERYRTIATVQRVGDDLDESLILLDEKTGRVKLGPSRQNADEALVGEAILTALQNADGPLTEVQIEELVDARTGLKRRALRQLVAREQANRIGRGGKGDPYRYAVSCSRSLVPIYMGEQENKNDDSVVSLPKSDPDSCSHVRAQGSCSRERVEL